MTDDQEGRSHASPRPIRLADERHQGFGGRTRVARAFRHRTFVVLWSSMLVYRVGFWVGSITFQWLVARTTDTSPLMLGLLSFFNLIPMLLLSPLSGVLADRIDRRHIMVVTQAFVAVVAGFLAVLIATGHGDSLPALFTFAFVFGIAMAFNAPANQAAVANAVPREDLGSAISLNAIAMNLSRIAGPALAGPMLIAWGAGPTFGLWALMSLAGAVALGRITFTPYEPEVNTHGVFRRIADGIDHARDRSPALLALALVGAVSALGTSYVAVIAVIAYDTLGQGDRAFTMLVSFTGIGAIIGALFAGHRNLTPSLSHVAWWAAAYGLVQGAFAMSRSLALSLMLIALVGGLNFYVMTSLNTLLQHLIAEAKRGRVMSLFMLAWAGLYPVGSLGLGALGQAVSLPAALLAFALVLSAFSVWVATREPSREMLPIQSG